MKITVFSDVHGDIYSLERLFEIEKSDVFICLGDMVGYGPYGDECLALARDFCGMDGLILGNHEEMFKRKEAFSSCSDLAKKFFEVSFQRFTKHQFLEDIPLSKNLEVSGINTQFVHTLEQRHIYPDTMVKRSSEFDFTFIGHSHIQFVKKLEAELLINVGSLGQNRKNKNLASYINFFTDSLSVEYGSFHSPKARLISDMKKMGYPSSLLDYYR